MASKRKYPPLDGSIPVFPGFVDFHAEHNPDWPYAIFPSKDHPGETESISFLEFAHATYRIAHYVRPGRTGNDGEVVAVLINCDILLYAALLAGLIKAGVIPFPMSPRNSPEAICNMLEKTGCTRIITQASMAPLISKVVAQMTAKGVHIRTDDRPILHAIFPTLHMSKDEKSAYDPPEPYPSTSIRRKPDDTVIYLHSAGSTGFPKPVPHTERTSLQWCWTPSVQAHIRYGLRSAAMLTPSFHVMGVQSQLVHPMASGEPIGIFAPEEPLPPPIPNAQNILEVAKLTKCDSMNTVPIFLEQWAQSPETVEWLRSCRIIRYAGGPLSTVIGDRLVAAGVRLAPVFGGTEFGAPTLFFDTDDSQGPDAPVKTSADWSWLQFADNVNIRWVDQGDGTYELQFLTCPTHKPAVENLPDVKGYSTKDLFEPHPTKKGLWRPVSRLDDVIVLSIGEKIVPIPQEGYIGIHPCVSGVVMFGRGRAQAGVLIELREKYAFDPSNQEALAAFRNMIWPHIEEANKLAPTFARIFKEMIIVTDPARPMARSSKSSVQRRMTLNEYRDEIEKLYAVVEASADAKGIEAPNDWNPSAIESWLSGLATSIAADQKLDPNVDFFEQGFDSLSATFLRNRIIGALRNTPETSIQHAAAQIAQDFVYSHPTIRSLTFGIVRLLSSGEGFDPSHGSYIRSLINKYTPSPPASASEYRFADPKAAVVVLTGSTGHLGSHILASLLQQDGIGKVYTLNRGGNVPKKQRNAFESGGIPLELLEDRRLVQLSTDISRSDLGLSSEVLPEIKSTATHLIHNAWKVDFNLSLVSFEPHIASTRNLLEFALSFSHKARIIFTSSIAATFGWDTSKGPVPETVLDLPDALEKHGNGYSQGKFIVEQIMAQANRTGYIRATSVRVGQLSGSTKSGAWNPKEWVPSIVKSSVTLGYLPLRDEAVSWLPIDVVALAIIEITLSANIDAEVLNIVHPRPIPWNQVFTDIAKTLASKSNVDLRLIPYTDWLSKVEQHSATPTEKDLQLVPGLKILQFLRRLNSNAPNSAKTASTVQFSTARAEAQSRVIRDAPGLDASQVELWISYWDKIGFLFAGAQDVSAS